MKTNIVKITSLILLIFNLNVFAQSKYEAPTLSAGLDNIAFNQGTLDVELLMEIIKEKQKELVKEGVKRFLINNIIKADDFYTQFYLERIVSILFEEKNHQVMTKKILEETTNYLFIVGTTEFVLNTKAKNVFDFLLSSNDSINRNEKYSIKDINKNDKDKLIYFIYYICKDNKIIKELGMLNNFNYFELNHKSNNTEFEEIRDLTDNIFKIVDYIKKSKSLDGFFKNLDTDKYNVFQKTLNAFGIKISNETNKNIIVYLKNPTEKINQYNIIKQILSIFGIKIENTVLDNEIKKLYDNFENNKTEINNKINTLIKSITILNNYAKGDNLINNFNLEEYEALKSIVKSFGIEILNEKEENTLIEFLKKPKENRDKLSEELNNINKKIIKEFIKISVQNQSETYVKIKNILAIIHFIEDLLNNHDELKDVINIAGINKNNLTDKIEAKYKNQVNEYDSNNILPFTNKGKDYSEYFNFLTTKINSFEEKTNAYNVLRQGLSSWNNLSKLITENNINENWSDYKNNINNALESTVKFNDINELITAINSKNNHINIHNDKLTQIQKTLELLNEKSNNFIKIDALTSNKELKSTFKSLFLLQSTYVNSLEFNYSEPIINRDLLKLKNIISKFNELKKQDFFSIYNIGINSTSESQLKNIISTINNLNVLEENEQEKTAILATLEQFKEFYEITDNNTSLNTIILDGNETILNETNIKIRLEKLFETHKSTFKILNYNEHNIIEFYNKNKDNLTSFSTKIKDKISLIKNELNANITIKHDEKLTQIFAEISTQFDELKNKIKVHFLGEDISQVFKIIRKELKKVSINYHELKEEDIKTLKKFNRIVLRRNLLDNISGLNLVKELDDELMSDLYFIKSSMKDSIKANKFELILNTTEFAISNMIKKQVNKEKPFFKEIESNINQYMNFIKFIGNIKELNKAETFSYLLKTMSNYKELFNLKDDNSLVDIVNSIRTYSIINNEKNVIEIDAASVLTHFTEKYKKHKYVPYNKNNKGGKLFHFLRNNSHFYATVGVNQSSIPNYKEIEGITSKSFSSASEKLGVKLDLWDFTRDNYKESKMMHQIKRKPLVSNIYSMAYASGILYKVANTTDNGFKSANAGLAFGLSFFNSLDFNVNVAVPLEGNSFENYFFGFSFDIPLSEYLSRL